MRAGADEFDRRGLLMSDATLTVDMILKMKAQMAVLPQPTHALICRGALEDLMGGRFIWVFGLPLVREPIWPEGWARPFSPGKAQ